MSLPVINDVLPAVEKIVSDAERQLSQLVGYAVKIHMSIKANEITEHVLQMLICDYYKVNWRDIIGTRGSVNVCNARQIYCYLLNAWLSKGYKYISNQIKRDRTSAMHSIETIKGYIEVGDENTLKAIRHFGQQLQLPALG